MSKHGMNYYHNIYTLPVLYWDMINKTNDLSFLLKSPELKQPKTVKLEDIWQRIYHEYIDVFGLGEKQIEYFKMRAKWSNLYTQVHLDDRRDLITFAKIEEIKMKEFLENLEGGDLTKSCAMMFKYFGSPINPLKISVFEFYSNVKLMNEQPR